MEERQPHQLCASSALSDDGAPFSVLWLCGTVAGLRRRQPLQREETREVERKDKRWTESRFLPGSQRIPKLKPRKPCSPGLLMVYVTDQPFNSNLLSYSTGETSDHITFLLIKRWHKAFSGYISIV